MTMVWTVYEDMLDDDLMATICIHVHLHGEISKHALFPSIATVADAGLLLPLTLPIWFIVV